MINIAIVIAAIFFGIGIYYTIDAIRIRQAVIEKLEKQQGEEEFYSQIMNRKILDAIKNGPTLNVSPGMNLLHIVLDLAENENVLESYSKKKILDILKEYNDWRLQVIKRALQQLKSDEVDNVITACQTISVLGDLKLNETLGLVKKRWRNNPRVVREIDMTQHSLVSVN